MPPFHVRSPTILHDSAHQLREQRRTAASDTTCHDTKPRKNLPRRAAKQPRAPLPLLPAFSSLLHASREAPSTAPTTVHDNPMFHTANTQHGYISSALDPCPNPPRRTASYAPVVMFWKLCGWLQLCTGLRGSSNTCLHDASTAWLRTL